MIAARLHRYHDPLTVEQIAEPTITGPPAASQVRVPQCVAQAYARDVLLPADAKVVRLRVYFDGDASSQLDIRSRIHGPSTPRLSPANSSGAHRGPIGSARSMTPREISLK